MKTLVQNIFSNGERFPMLIDEVGVPDFWVSKLEIKHNNRLAKWVKSIDLNFNYEQIMKELAVVLKDIAAAQP